MSDPPPPPRLQTSKDESTVTATGTEFQLKSGSWSRQFVRIENSSSRDCENEEHRILEPFFTDNVTLRSIWADQPNLLQELNEVSEDVDTGMFASRGFSQLSGLEFNENTWTKHLVGSLKTCQGMM